MSGSGSSINISLCGGLEMSGSFINISLCGGLEMSGSL